MSEYITNTKGRKQKVDRLKPLFRVLQFLTNIINLTGIVIVVTTLTSMFLALFVNVILRYAFNSGITWAYEIHNILLPWLIAGGAVMAAIKSRNIAVKVVVDILPEIWRRNIDLLVHGFVAVLCVGVVYSSIPIVRAAQYSHLAETGISQLYGYLSLIYAFSTIAVISIVHLVYLLLRQEMGESDPASSSFS